MNLKDFNFNDLKNATMKFHLDSILGQEGFGSVFEGWIDEHGFMAAGDVWGNKHRHTIRKEA